MDFLNIEPKIIIESILNSFKKIQVYCFDGMPKIIIKIHNENEISIYDENLNITEDIFDFEEEKIFIKVEDFTKQSVDLSKKLSEPFKFVRVDWIVFENRLYFEELTFTPYSGFNKGLNKIIEYMRI